MRVIVLGSAAGGGVPQWNCRCPVCTLAWRRDGSVRWRTQTSLAVSADSESWVLLDAAPELREQILSNPSLHPRRPGRHSPIAAVVLTSGDVDHLAGLLCLREGHRFTLWAAEDTLRQVAASPVFGVLDPSLVDKRVLPTDESTRIAGLTMSPFAVPGKVPLYREAEEQEIERESGSVIGLEVSDGRGRLCYVPGIAHLTPALAERLGGADVLFLDGTAYTDDELPRLGLSPKTAARMGHLAITGDNGSMRAFVGTRAQRHYIHLNNTNPVLVENSAERATVEDAGWTVAHDGLEIVM